MLRTILIINSNKRSCTRQVNKYENKTRKREATTCKSYKKLMSYKKVKKSSKEVKKLYKVVKQKNEKVVQRSKTSPSNQLKGQ